MPSTTWPSSDADVVLGAQRPRIAHFPGYESSTGDEAIKLAALAGLELDDWQQFVLRHALGEGRDGRWSASTVGLVVGRQNGKGAVLEARELAGLFLLGEELILHTAHQQKTASEHFRRLLARINSVPEFKSRVLSSPRGKGSEAIELRTGQRAFFMTRAGSNARGLTADLIVYDEAMHLTEDERSDIVPTVAARTMQGNIQSWYTGSAVDQENPKHNGVPFARIRESGIAQTGDIAYFEWSLDWDDPSHVPEEIASDPEVQASTNPSYGIRISPRWIEHERTVELGPRGFAVERLGVGDWPDTSEGHRVIDPQAWADCCDPESEVKDPVCLAFDVTPDRAKACVAVAGWRADGNAHVEVIRHGRGTAWVGETLAALAAKNKPLAIVCVARAGGALLPKLEEDYGLRVAEKGHPRGRIVPATGSEHQDGCGVFYDAVDQRVLRHRGDPVLDAAVSGAVKRSLTDGWTWDKRKSDVDISPLVACTIALWGLHEHARRGAEVISMSDVLAESQSQDERKRTGHAPVTPEDSDWLRGE